MSILCLSANKCNEYLKKCHHVVKVHHVAPLTDFHEFNIDFFNCCFLKAILFCSTSTEGIKVEPINLFNSTSLLLLFLKACKSKDLF